MKLTDLVCHECGFEQWEIVFEPVYRVKSDRCPNCGVLHIAIVNFKPQQEYLGENDA